MACQTDFAILLSMGWGSNSQWRTAFRRDYRQGDLFLYNVDGRASLDAGASHEDDRDGLTFEERVELCRNRCILRTRKDDSDLWPYDDSYQELVRTPTTVKPEWLRWNDGTVAKLAQTIETERAFDCLPLLADALEEAGCDNQEILDHCRSTGEHVRGCWVVDLLLGKS
jgi:hypothetical protein